MLNIIVFGAPGCGKGTQSERIVDHFGLHHISTGQLLRGHISRQTELGKVADSYISKGQLIPDDLMLDVLAAELDEHPAEIAKGVIFDGFPRTIPQAEALEQLFAKRGMTLGCVLGLEVPEEDLVQRIIKRGQETGRADDTPETIRARMAVYHSQTSPLCEYYKQRGQYRAIDGSRTPDEIFADIKSELEK